ncbi:aminotransferase class I/II-fold pyridoxal phosphate-dependent enzyme [Salinispira pacifica]
MNTLAVELNGALEGTIVHRLLSDFGRRIYFPKGIVAQSAEADRRATRFNATVGMAYSHREPLMLPTMHKLLEQLTPKEAVAYAPTAGVAELRDLWQQEMIFKNPTLKGKSFMHPVVTPGLTNGIYQTASLFFNPGDVVLIPDMFWGNYRLIFEEQKGGKVVAFPFFDDQMRLNTEALRRALRENSGGGRIALLLNFPNNPTGYSPTRAEAAQITRILVEQAESGTDLLAIMDDAYFGLFYDEDTATESLFAPLADAHERILAVKVDGATKEEFVWGFRVGFVTCASRGLGESHYAALERKLMGAIRSTISNSSGLAQHLLLKVMKSPGYREEKRTEFRKLQGRYLRLRELLSSPAMVIPRDERSDRPLLEPLPFNSGYFMSFRCNGISAETLRLALLEKGIGVISIQDAFLRVAFASIDETDLEALYSEIFRTAGEVPRT